MKQKIVFVVAALALACAGVAQAQQKPATFNLDDVMKKLGASHGK